MSNYPPTINHPFNHLFSQFPYIITVSHYNEQPIYISYSIFIWFPFQPTHHPINMSVYYKTLLILYIFRAPINNSFSYMAVSHLSSPYLIHYNHFHYGNRIPRQSSAIPIMHNYSYSFIDFRNEIRLKPSCIIIHLNCINIHSFGFHYGNHLLIIGFYYGICLWHFIFSSAYIRAHV